MKKLLLLPLLLLFNSIVVAQFIKIGTGRIINAVPTSPGDSIDQAHTYYFAPWGNNSNSGTSWTAPFLNATKFNSLSLANNDTIRFRQGQSWSGQKFVLNHSNISVLSYGFGEADPVIDGSIPITGWSTVSGTLKEAPCSSCGSILNMVKIDNQNSEMGRTPNSGTANGGYLGRYNSGDTLLQNETLLGKSLVGTTIIAKVYLYILTHVTVLSQRVDSVIFGNGSGAGIYSAGFFWQNDSTAANLDLNKEWYYSPTRKVIRMRMDNDPTTYTVRAGVVDTLFSMDGLSNVNIQGITFTGANKIGVYLNNCSNIIFNRLTSTFHGLDGFNGNGCHDIITKYSRIENVNNNGSFFPGAYNCTWIKDTLHNIATLTGMGQDSHCGYGIYFEKVYLGAVAHHNTVDSCLIDSVGYVGIRPSGHDLHIGYNDISKTGITKADGAGIYLWDTWGSFGDVTDSNYNVVIEHNYLHDNEGNTYATSFGGVKAVHGGGYHDDGGNGALWINNTFANNPIGLLWHNVQRDSAIGNTFYNNGNGSLDAVAGGGQMTVGWDDIVGVPSQHLYLKRNEYISTDTSQYQITLGANNRSGYNFNFFDLVDSNNVVSAPRTGHSRVLRTVKQDLGNTFTYYSVLGWNTLFGYDLHTTENPAEWFTYTGFSIPDFFALNMNNTFATINPSISGTWKDRDNNSITSPPSIAPFSSLPLVKTSTITDTYPPERWGFVLDNHASPNPGGASGYVSDPLPISFSTNESCTCKYATTDIAYGSMSNTFTGTGTNHSISITRPDPGTFTTFYVRCSDGVNVNTDSYALGFRIGAAAYDIVVTNLSTTSVKITWTTLENTDSKVDYGTTTSYGSNVFNASLVQSHSLTITGLSSGTTYHYKITDFDGVSTYSSADLTFTTL